MNKLFFRLSLLFLFFGAVFQSCQKETFQKVKVHEKYKVNFNTTYNAHDVFGRTLAIALKTYPELQEFIINEANKKYDGDTEVLYLMVKDNKIRGKYFHEILYDTYTENMKLRSNFGENIPNDYFSVGIVTESPYLTISIPSEVLNSEVLSLMTPVIAIAQDGVNEDDIINLIAYDEDGNSLKVDAQEYPNNIAVYVIRLNESVKFVNKETLTTIEGDPLAPILGRPVGEDDLCDGLEELIKDFTERIINGETWLIVVVQILNQQYEAECQDGPEDPGPCTAECDRDCNDNPDRITTVLVKSKDEWQNLESWWKGNTLELRVIVSYALVGSNIPGLGQDPQLQTIQKMINLDKSQVFNKNCSLCDWTDPTRAVPVNITTLNWIPENYRSVMKYSWREEDWGDTKPFAISLGVPIPGFGTILFSTTFQISDQDKIIGDDIMNYCDHVLGKGVPGTPGTPISYFLSIE